MLSEWTIPVPDPAIGPRVQRALDGKTKPPGSLGQLEALAVRLATAQGTEAPVADPAHLLIFAGDHGLVAEGVSAWPQEVTAQMVRTFLAGGAAATVFAKVVDCRVTVADAGVAGDLSDAPGLVRATIRAGTRNAAREDALTPAEVAAALEFGARLAAEAATGGSANGGGDAGARVLALGEMGIGNTSAATLLAHKVAGLDLDELTGPGAGLDPDGVVRKRAVLGRAAARHPGPLAPDRALAAFGGLEIAAMAGALVGAASRRAVVLVDGFIASAAALMALTARPEARPYTIFAHRSHEPGHGAILRALEARPLLDLDLRLGEGTGAVLALPLLRAAAAMVSDMATFDAARVSGRI